LFPECLTGDCLGVLGSWARVLRPVCVGTPLELFLSGIGLYIDAFSCFLSFLTVFADFVLADCLAPELFSMSSLKSLMYL